MTERTDAGADLTTMATGSSARRPTISHGSTCRTNSARHTHESTSTTLAWWGTCGQNGSAKATAKEAQASYGHSITHKTEQTTPSRLAAYRRPMTPGSFARCNSGHSTARRTAAKGKRFNMFDKQQQKRKIAGHNQRTTLAGKLWEKHKTRFFTKHTNRSFTKPANRQRSNSN